MRIWGAIGIAAVALSLCACTREDAREAGRDSREAADSAARKAGRAAHKIADEADEAARKAGKKLKEAAREARAGWNDADKDRDKPKK